MVAILLPILLTSQVFCQTRERNDKIDAYNDINDILYESSGEDYVESSGEDYVGDINPEGGNDITYESSADDDYIIPDKVDETIEIDIRVLERLDDLEKENQDLKYQIIDLEKILASQSDDLQNVSGDLTEVVEQLILPELKNEFVLSGADAKDMKYFKISCNGSCKGINIRLDPPQVNEIEKGGDPDLCVSEDKLPFNLEECSTCISRSAWEDWCRDIETSKDHFFVMVAAYESYDNAVLKITGGNIKTIEETDNDKAVMLAQFEEKILKIINDTVETMTETFEKDISNITDSLDNILVQIEEIENQPIPTTTEMPTFNGPLIIGSVSSKARKYYKATCSSSCGRVTVRVSATSGDPDLYVGSSKGTSSYCSRDGSGSSDSCTVTVRDTYFYVRVLAYRRLSNAKLEITGGNMKSVEEVDVVDQTTISTTTISPITISTTTISTTTISTTTISTTKPTTLPLIRCPTEVSTSTTWFKEVAGKCYYIMIKGCPDGDGCTFDEAQTVCSSVFGSGISGIVFEPTTSAINDAVLQTALDTTGSNMWFWIGVKNGDLTYQSNGNPVSLASIPWRGGHPQKRYDCVSAQSRSRKWESKDCDIDTLYTICETTISTTTNSTATIPTNITSSTTLPSVKNCPVDAPLTFIIDGGCFMFVNQQKSPNDAKSFCETKLGRLFEPRSASTNKLVYDKGNDILPGVERWWIGVVTYNGISGPWQFASSGENMVSGTWWYIGQPNEDYADEIWAYFGSNCGNEKWCDAPTSNRNRFICEFV